MDEGRPGRHARSRFICVLRDVHLWVPLAVLVGGLLILRWIQ